MKMKNGKAAGLDNLSCEHLKYSHPILSVLCKLFTLFLANGCVPDSFGQSYMVPLPKNSTFNRCLTVDDFRQISISPVISKVFEHTILERFARYFVMSDNQFGFKRYIGCQHVIYRPNVRNIISTIRITALRSAYVL